LGFVRSTKKREIERKLAGKKSVFYREKKTKRPASEKGRGKKERIASCSLAGERDYLSKADLGLETRICAPRATEKEKERPPPAPSSITKTSRFLTVKKGDGGNRLEPAKTTGDGHPVPTHSAERKMASTSGGKRGDVEKRRREGE